MKLHRQVRIWIEGMAVIVGLSSCGGVDRESSSSSTKDVTDILSMNQQSDRNFAVTCRGGRQETVTAQQIKLGQGCVSGNQPGSSGIYCKQTSNDQTNFSPARVDTGAWLDDGPGTDLSTCKQQLVSIAYGVYCRQLKTNGRMFSPAHTYDGAWLDDSAGTELNSCVQQLSRSFNGIYCRQLKTNATQFSPARLSDGSWLDNSPGTTLDICLQQI